MSAPHWQPVDEPTADLLSLIADDLRKDTLYTRFLRACETDHELEGYVSVNRVRRRLSNEYGLIIEPRLYSSFWAKATGKNGPMVKMTSADDPEPWDICKGSGSGNDGKPQRKRKWVGV